MFGTEEKIEKTLRLMLRNSNGPFDVIVTLVEPVPVEARETISGLRLSGIEPKLFGRLTRDQIRLLSGAVWVARIEAQRKLSTV